VSIQQFSVRTIKAETYSKSSIPVCFGQRLQSLAEMQIFMDVY